MILFRLALVTLAVASFVEGGVVPPLHLESNGDQYEGLWGGGSEPQVEMARFHDEDATDRRHDSTKDSEESSRRHSSVIYNLKSLNDAHEEHQRKSETDMEYNRNKRSYYPYAQYNNYQVPQFQSLNAWKPTVYSLQQPYYIPVFGIDGNIPIYIPQQPIYLNQGNTPQNQEKNSYLEATYLPPTHFPSVTSSVQTVRSRNRFGSNDDEDRPIWDNEDEQSVLSTTETSIRRKRKPLPSDPKTTHKGYNDASIYNHLSVDAVEMSVTTTEQTGRKPRGPSRCILAIISCCSTASKVANTKCFRQFGCAGPFWDMSPCEKTHVKLAMQKVSNFYKSKS